MAGFDDRVFDLFEGGGEFDGDDLGSSGHGLVDLGIAELDDGLDHLAFLLADDALLLAVFDGGEDVFFDLFGLEFGVCAGDFEDEAVDGVHDLDEGKEDDAHAMEKADGEGDEGFAGVACDGGGDGDGANESEDRGEGDGGGVLDPGWPVGLMEEAEGEDEEEHVGGEASDGGDEGEVELVFDGLFEPAGAFIGSEAVFKASAREIAQGVADGGEEEGGEG